MLVANEEAEQRLRTSHTACLFLFPSQRREREQRIGTPEPAGKPRSSARARAPEPAPQPRTPGAQPRREGPSGGRESASGARLPGGEDKYLSAAVGGGCRAGLGPPRPGGGSQRGLLRPGAAEARRGKAERSEAAADGERGRSPGVPLPGDRKQRPGRAAGAAWGGCSYRAALPRRGGGPGGAGRAGGLLSRRRGAVLGAKGTAQGKALGKATGPPTLGGARASEWPKAAPALTLLCYLTIKPLVAVRR